MKVISKSEQALVLRRLEGEMKSAQQAAAEAGAAASAAHRRQAGNLKRAAELQKEIDALAQARVGAVVSEHALLRWLERVHGVDLDAIRQEMLSGPTAGSIEFAGTGEVKKGAATLVFKDRVVVTVKI